MSIHFPRPRGDCRISQIFAAALLFSLACLGHARAVVTESLSITIPDPYIVDVEALDADPLTNRNALLAEAVVTISKSIFDGGFSRRYRVRYHLEDAGGNILELAPGGVFEATTDPILLVVPGGQLVRVLNFDLVPDPLNTLDPAVSYRVVGTLEHEISTIWSDVPPAKTSPYTQVLHFTNLTTDDLEYNYRGFLNNLVWDQTYMVDTDPNNDRFLASVDFTVGRYDEFDKPITVDPTPTTFDFDLLDGSLNSIPLPDDGIFTLPVNPPSYEDSSGRPLPIYASSTLSNFEIKPLTQLDSTQTYTLRCTLSHEEDPLFTVHVDMVLDHAPQQLLHFNGNLFFGSVATTFDEITNSPGPLGGGLGYVSTQLALGNEAGTLPDAAPYVFGDGTVLDVQLEPDGDAVLAAVSASQTAHPPGLPAGIITRDINGTRLKYTGGVQLTPTGAVANGLTICFPQGLGYLPDITVDDKHGEPDYVHAGLTSLTSSLALAGNVSVTLGTNARIFDESHPLALDCANFSLQPGGELVFDTTTGEYIHQTALAYLESLPAFWDAPSMMERYSNDLYWRAFERTAGAGTTTCRAATDGSCRIDAINRFDPFDFRTHYPLETSILWNSTSEFTFINGVPDTTVSLLLGVPKIDVPFSINCADDPCGGNGTVLVTEIPDANVLHLTPSGGLWRHGVTNAPTQLEWGARGDGMGGVTGYAHRTNAFNDTAYYMPGYQLYAADNVLLSNNVYAATAGDNAPGALLLSAFNEDPTLAADLHLPTEAAYVAGDGAYRGLNFVVDTPGFGGATRFGGNPTDFTYDLLETNNASKYYISLDGVSGRHVAKDGTWGPSLQIYGYEFSFSSIQMRFLSSEMEPPSWINGTINVDGYSTFSQKFLGLTLSCIGELEDAELDPTDLGAKSMNHWNSDFLPLSMRFAKVETGACPQMFDGFLEMGVQTTVAHVPGDLYGIFGFRPDGNLLTPGDAVEGITSELGLPAGITIDGPNKDYEFVNTSDLRFSNPYESGEPTSSITGFVTWAGTVNVPYFRDFLVQAITSANDTPAAAFYMASGWDEGGKTFFANGDFDPNHKCWPIGVPLADYQKGDNPTYLIHAEQDMFGSIALDYPMKYDSVTRTFRSADQVIQDDIFVINIQHEVTYLDAKFTSLEFGAKYDGLPQLDLTNLLNDQIDGAAALVAQELGGPVKGAMDHAFEEFDKMLSDTLAEAFDPVIDAAADTVIGPVYGDLKASYDLARSAGDTYGDWQTSNFIPILEAQIYKAGFASDLHQQLLKIKDAGEGTASFVDNLQAAVESMIIGIDTIANAVDIQNGDPVFHKTLGSIPGGAEPGLLMQNSGEFEIISNLVRLLLRELTPPEVAAILAPLIDAASSELNAELNILLEEIKPALLQIIETLNQVREFLVTIHDQIQNVQGIVAKFNDVIALAVGSGELDSILAGIFACAQDQVTDLANSHGINAGDDLDDFLSVFDDLSEPAFVAAVKSELKDLIVQSDIVEQIQFLVRQEINDIQLLFESTIQSTLDQLTNIVKEVISASVGELTSGVTDVLGEVSNFMGSGEISGYAEFNGDSLRKLRMDGVFTFNMPDEMQLHVYLEVLAYNSEDNFVENACLKAGEKAVEVRIGAIDVDLDWISDGLRASLEVKMSLKDKGAGMLPNGVGGSFEITGGEIDFTTVKITCFKVTMAIGFDEAYLGAKACGIMNSYEVTLGIFFGRTCTLDPLYFVDPDVAELIEPGTTFTGVYVYAEVWLPISEIVLGIPASCLFRVSAGIGFGVGFFVEGPTFVTKMLAGVSGEALCIVSFKALIKLVGIIQAGKPKLSGAGSVDVCIGPCPFCLCFGATIKLKYNDGSWAVDY